MAIFVLFVLIHLNIFAQKADSAPDTHVHIYVPPEQEGAAQNTGFENHFNQALLGMDYGGKPNQKTKYESESGTTEVPRSTAAKELPRNDGDEAFGDMVNCGGHTARTCDQCPYDDDIYRGSYWCNGDCEYRTSPPFKKLGCREKRPGRTMVNCGGHVAEECGRCPIPAANVNLRPSYCHGECEWDFGCSKKMKTGLEAKVIEWKYNMEFSGFLDPYRSCAEVGQEVIFKWDPPVGRHAGHLLLQVTKEQYDSCTGFDRPTSGSMTAGEKNVGSFEEGTYYFVNPVDHYCSSGPQRVPVTVPCPND